MLIRILLLTLISAMYTFSQTPPIEPGVSQELARWRAAHYSDVRYDLNFAETKPISTYVFAFAAGPWERVSEPPASAGGQSADAGSTLRGTTGAGRSGRVPGSTNWPPAHAGGSDIYVRRSQAEKFKPHAAEVFRLNREAVRYFEEYFDYKFPFPKYDLVATG